MKKDTQEYRTRLKEMTAVLRKYGGIRGLTPQKLRKFLEELGPTYVKLGQILSTRSDMIPKKYCEELMHLCSDVEPMPFEEVEVCIRGCLGAGMERGIERDRGCAVRFSLYCTGA